MADKNAVGDRDGRDAEHTQQCGDEKFAEQAAYMFRPEVQCVSFHKPKLLLFTGGHKKRPDKRRGFTQSSYPAL